MVGLHGVLIGFSYSLTGFITYGCMQGSGLTKHPADNLAGYFAPPGQFQWRFPLAVQLIPCTVLFVGSFFLPESPRWVRELRPSISSKLIYFPAPGKRSQ
jgi:hypothetical protein